MACNQVIDKPLPERVLTPITGYYETVYMFWNIQAWMKCPAIWKQYFDNHFSGKEILAFQFKVHRNFLHKCISITNGSIGADYGLV